jgi:opine dehydrogenase
MKILVIGAGNSGLAMAAHLSFNGDEVTLWNRTKINIDKLMQTKTICCEGIIRGDIKISKVTDDINEALKDVEIIMVTTPASAHKDISFLLSKNMKDPIPIILNPGRTFGALEFRNSFKKDVVPSICETQTIIYTCRKISDTRVNITSIKKDVLISSFNKDSTNMICSLLPRYLRKNFKIAENMIETSIGNVGMILHCAPTLLNTGWIENESNNFKYYYEGITPSIADFLEKLDFERVSVSEKLGHKVESTMEWMKRSYNLEGKSLYQCIKNNNSYKYIDAPNSLNHRYILEDVSCGLVPLFFVGKQLGLEMPLTSLIIDLASAIMKIDFKNCGRNISRLRSKEHDLKNILGNLK